MKAKFEKLYTKKLLKKVVNINISVKVNKYSKKKTHYPAGYWSTQLQMKNECIINKRLYSHFTLKITVLGK